MLLVSHALSFLAFVAPFQALNVLWVSFIVVDSPDDASKMAAAMAKSTFTTMPRTDFLILCQDENKALPISMEALVEPVKLDYGHPKDFKLFRCPRGNYVAELHIRESLVEDNDALAPIFERNMNEITSSFGDFFLADIISSQSDKKKCLTAVVNGKPVGLMSFSSDIQVSMLQKCFDLRPYSNLLKIVAEEEIVVDPDWCTCLLSKLPELGAQLSGDTVDFTTLSELIKSTGNKWECKPEEIVERLSRCMSLARGYGMSLTWAELETTLRVHSARQTVWTWYKSKEGGRQVLYDLHQTSKGSKDDMLDLLEKQRAGLAAACDSGFNFDGLEKVEDLINYDDLVVTDKELTDSVDQFEAAMTTYNGCKTSFCGVNSPLKRLLAAKLAAASGITLVEVDEVHTAEVARIKENWTDPDADPPEQLTEEQLCAVMVKRLSQPDCSGGRGYVLLDFPRNKEQSDALLAAEIIIDNIIFFEDDRFQPPPETKMSRVQTSLNQAKTRVGQVATVSGRVKEFALYRQVLRILLDYIAAAEARKKPQVRTVQRVKGNAFAITLFTLDSEYEASAGEFMEKAFALFPDHDYCIITRPHTATDSWLLQQFTRVAAVPKSTFSHVVYIMHRYGVYGIDELTVVRGKSGDTTAIGRLLNGIGDDQETMQAFQESLKCDTRLKDDPEHVTFLAHVNKQVVAVAVLNRSWSTTATMTDLHERFRLEQILPAKQHSPAQHATLTHFAVNPIFKPQSRVILSEVMRLYNKSALLTVVYPSSPVPPVAAEFVQVQPHKLNQLMYSDKQADNRAFGLFVLPRRLLSEPKIANNTRIVVVGSSDAGLSFLETLLFVPYMQFTHLTLISNNGISTGRSDRLSSPAELLERPSTYTKLEMQQLRIDANIQVINNSMISIDREAKCVILPGPKADVEELVPYDVLVLTSGLRERTDAALGVEEDALPKGVLPCLDYNVVKAAKALEQAALTGEDGDPVVVYGGTLHALQVLEAAIQAQVPTSRLVWAFPSAPDELAQPDILWKTVQEKLRSIGIKLMPKLRISNLSTTDNTLTGVQFQDASAPYVKSDEGDMLMSWQPKDNMADASLTTVSASLLLCAARADVDPEIFFAVNESGLVYDGRIVVDERFRTVDKNIFSAGTVTKFSRRLRPKSNQEAYSSREVGTKLAASVLQQVDELAQPVMEGLANKLPTFNLPRMQVYRLPGGMHFTMSVIAERPPPHETLMTKHVSDDDQDMRLTWVTLDRHQRVAKIMYLGSAEVEERNLRRLVGCNESFLKSLKHAHDVGLCHDFILYFRQPWADALYSHHFEEFVESMQKHIGGDTEVDKLLEKMHAFKTGKDGQRLDRVAHAIQDTVGLGGCKLAPSTRKSLQQMVLDFVVKHHKLLSMYWIPKTS